MRNWGSGVCLEVNIAAHEEDPVADALEVEDPILLEVEHVAAHAAAAGHRDRAEPRLIHLVRPNLTVDVVILVIELEETVVFLGAFDDGVEVRELLLRVLSRRRRGQPEPGEEHGGAADGRQHSVFHGEYLRSMRGACILADPVGGPSRSQDSASRTARPNSSNGAAVWYPVENC